ncbi:MAG: TonB-dependent receptor [Sphingobacteriales bacterium]|nr:MAG: TonB-dependent receptor [Sphingobacteriales bacterium]
MFSPKGFIFLQLRNLRFVLFILMCSVSMSAAAQQSGSITGTVADKNTPLEFATVNLYNLPDTLKPVRNSLTDATGKFTLENLSAGRYLLTVSLIGYKPYHQNINLNKEQSIIDAGTITLIAEAKQLGDVTVTSTKPVIQKTNRGLVLNAASTLTQAGGTATDLLRNTPTVVVDEDGNITLRGKTPLILINGRNSAITNTEQIAASAVERIEIINNPSAQFDANSEAGIINIVLKKNRQNGTNGALAIGTGFGAKARFNSAAMISHKTGNWNLSLAYDNRFAGRIRKINAERQSFDIPDQYYLIQHRNDNRLDQLQNLRAVIGFSPDTKNSFELEAVGVLDYQDNHEDLNNTIRNNNKAFTSRNDRFSNEYERGKEAEFVLNYGRKFANKKVSLTGMVSTSIERDGQNTGITTKFLTESDGQIGDPQLQRTNNHENGSTTNIKVDFAHPVTENGMIETGYKATLRYLDANFQSLNYENGVYTPNPIASSNFRFNENVHAWYVQYSAAAGKANNQKWKYDIGVRMEETGNNGTVKTTNQNFSNQYFKLFPSAGLAFNPSSSETWRFNYSRKINRPGFGQLNPFIDVTDTLNQHGGNPTLKPELIHSFELGYNKDWNKISYYAVAYYRNASNSIRQFTLLQTNGVALSIPQNFGSVITYGIENVFTAKPFSKYDFNLSASLYKQNIKGSAAGQELSNDVVSWHGKLINNFILWKGSKLQLTGVYNSPIALPQGKRIATYYADMGFQQKLGKKGNGRLSLAVTDIFNTLKYGSELKASNFSYNRYGKVDSRAIVVTFAYTFGTSFKEKLLENKYSND